MFTEKQLSRYADVLLWGLQTARNRKPAKMFQALNAVLTGMVVSLLTDSTRS